MLLRRHYKQNIDTKPQQEIEVEKENKNEVKVKKTSKKNRRVKD